MACVKLNRVKSIDDLVVYGCAFLLLAWLVVGIYRGVVLARCLYISRCVFLVWVVLEDNRRCKRFALFYLWCCELKTVVGYLRWG